MNTVFVILAAAAMSAGIGVAGGALAAVPPLNTLRVEREIGIARPIQHGNVMDARSDFTTTIQDRALTPCDDGEVTGILRGKKGSPAPTLVLPYLHQRVVLRGSLICPGSGSRFAPQPDDVFPIW